MEFQPRGPRGTLIHETIRPSRHLAVDVIGGSESKIFFEDCEWNSTLFDTNVHRLSPHHVSAKLRDLSVGTFRISQFFFIVGAFLPYNED